MHGVNNQRRPANFYRPGKTLRSHRRYWVLRRAQDIVFSLLALILLAPLALLISLAIVLDSPRRRSYFSGRRAGEDGTASCSGCISFVPCARTRGAAE